MPTGAGYSIRFRYTIQRKSVQSVQSGPTNVIAGDLRMILLQLKLETATSKMGTCTTQSPSLNFTVRRPA